MPTPLTPKWPDSLPAFVPTQSAWRAPWLDFKSFLPRGEWVADNVIEASSPGHLSKEKDSSSLSLRAMEVWLS